MLKQQTKLRVRLYARLSKDDGDADKESNSITNQLQMLRYNAKEKGFEVIGEYVDAAVIIGLKTLRLKKCQKHAAF
mgnify:CR=1 FL=1